jgi:hypothetical protein
MPLVPCPDCAHSNSPKRCRHCRGTGINLDVISGILTAPATAGAGIRDKCGWCGGNGQCQTCGGRGEISPERRPEVSDSRTIPHDVRGERESRPTRRDTSHDAGSSLREEPSRPSYSGGGGGGGGGDGPGIQGLAAILLFGIAVFLGWNYKKNHPEHYEVDIAVLDGEGHHPIRFLEYKPGTHQRINFSIWWGGGAYSGKPFEVNLLLNGKTLFTRRFENTDQVSSGFYLPYDSEFQPGHYVARVSLEGVGTRDYDFGVGLEKDIGGIDLGDPPVQPARQNGLTIFVADSFQGNHPWPPKNVIYAVPTEPKWLYAAVQSDASLGAATSVNATVICGRSPLLTQPSEIGPNSMVYFSSEQKLMAGRCVERVFLRNGTYAEFPFIVVEVERGSNPGEYKTIQDPDAAPPDVSSIWLQRGIAHSRAGQHDTAIRDFNVEIPDEITAYQLRGNEYAALGDYERAIADYSYILRWQPHNAWCLASRGSAYANLHDYVRAIADFKEAIRINPGYEDARERLTRVQQDLSAQQAVVSSTPETPTEAADGTATDPVGDAQPWPGVSVSPDLVSADAIAAGGVLAMHIQFAPSTFDPEKTEISIALDTDQDPSTGYHGFYPYTFDSNVLSTDYIIDIVTGGRVASINRCGGLLGSRCAGVSSTTIGVSPDEIGLSVPLPILHSNGKVNFKVCVSSFVPDKGYTPYLDCMPDKGLPPATSAVQ